MFGRDTRIDIPSNSYVTWESAAVPGNMAHDRCRRCASSSRCPGSSIRLPVAVTWVCRGRGNEVPTRRYGHWSGKALPRALSVRQATHEMQPSFIRYCIPLLSVGRRRFENSRCVGICRPGRQLSSSATPDSLYRPRSQRVPQSVAEAERLHTVNS
jgi:hypothetical protein